MNSKGLFGLIAGFGILGGGVAILMNTGGDSITVGNASITTIYEAVTEAQVADKAIMASNGKLVHIVGIEASKDAVVEDTDIGRSVTVDAIKENTECSVVFEAKEVTVTLPSLHGEKSITVKRVDLDLAKYPRAALVKMSGTEKDGSFIWNGLLTGQGCKTIALEPGYLGSSMQEFQKLPDATKARFLRTYGQCIDLDRDGKPSKDGKTHRCDVAYGDIRATIGEEIFFPHSFAGREHDLGIMPVKSGVVEKRYMTPDGGFATTSTEESKKD